MIERYSIAADAEVLQQRYLLESTEHYEKKYNAFPGQLLPILLHEGGRGLSYFYWGSRPVASRSMAERVINIRGELIEEKPVFKKKMKGHRCIIPADGFYCWKKIGKRQAIPWRFALPENPIFSIAGVWEEFENNGEFLHTFQLITRPHPLADITERMPVILSLEEEKTWMNTGTSEEELLALISTNQPPGLINYSVSPLLNSPSCNSILLFQPSPPADQFGNLTLFD